MDSIISSALTEILSQGPNGVSIDDLWPALQPSITRSHLHPCDAVKRIIWEGLLNTPGLEFRSQHKSFTPQHSQIQSFKNAQKLNLQMVAAQRLRDCFLGIYDFEPTAIGRAVLERLALVNTNGITQNQLSKELGIKGNKFFYVLKQLESRDLIVRHSAIVRTKENAPQGENGTDNTLTVHTNLIHLRRYAKHLGSQQKFEIRNVSGGTSPGDDYIDGVKEEDVFVRDYLPAMEFICAKLEEADDRVLVASDVEQAIRRQGHISWRAICARLVEAGVVEVFHAKVNKKVVNCLRLLKKFDPKYVQPNHTGLVSDKCDIDKPQKCGKRKQKLNQLLELPIEYQTYDLIEAQGTKGLSIIQVRKHLGINNKENHERIRKLLPRFGMDIQAETNHKSRQYKVWAAGNSTVKHGNSPCNENIDQNIPEPSTFKEELRSPNITTTAVDDGKELVNFADGSVGAPSETRPPSSSSISKGRDPIFPGLTTVESIRREQRILEKLQEEKFIPFAELHKWLKSLEQDREAAMATKTVIRLLSKLEAEGLCKCIHVSAPLVTNCVGNRTRLVVLHSSLGSLPNLSTELLSQIQERLRSFERNNRVQGLASLKEKEVPEMNNVERPQAPNGQYSQTKRVNGFVLAKMICCKLLHNFLWGYFRSSSDWDTALHTGMHGYDTDNPHSTCKVFTLNAAVKAMPVDLFLQIVGSAQNFEKLMENTKHGLCLAHLPLQEYTSLMDNHSKSRLSSLVHTLCDLKLLWKVTDKHAEDEDKTLDVISTYGMELKPYIEQPLSRISSSLGISSSNLRPKRHDFVLSTREAVDMYWKTLEYCYAAADPKSAESAFPGYAVKDVFLHRSWTSVRVMTADQRAGLLTHIQKDGPEKRISFLECVNIARDLNLTLEQVLRFLKDKRQSRLNKFLDKQNPNKNLHSAVTDFVDASQKRKTSSEAMSSKRVKCDKQSLDTANAEDPDFFLQGCSEDGQVKLADDSGILEENEEEGYNFISHCAFSRFKPSRRPRFMWSETSDKELVIQYVRHRAALGARFYRTDWASLPHLPASPDVCRRRMNALIHIPNIRRAIMRLCNLLGERYVHLSKSASKEILTHNITRQLDEEISPTVSPGKFSSSNSGGFSQLGTKTEQWDDFEDQNVKSALDEVMRLRQMAKHEGTKRSELLGQKEWSDNFKSATADKDTQNHEGRRHQRSRRRRLPGKFLKLLNGIGVSRHAYDSLSVANAVELLKLVFLSTSSAPEVPQLLAETLRRYSEHDLFEAFNYLREKQFMIGGNGSVPLVLSQKFLHRASSSPFPTNTGKRAAKFANWLREREHDSIEDTILLKDDLQCGDIVHLLALVSSGELSISPSLPDKGIGEAEENRSVKRKAAAAAGKNCSANNVKRLKASSEEDVYVARQAKGFPGIQVHLSRIRISKADALDLIPNQNIHACSSVTDTNNQVSASGQEQICKPSYTEIFASTAPPQTTADDGSQWETMSSYGNQLLSTSTGNVPITSLNPKLLKTAHSAIYGAGDQGLSMDQISEVLQGQEDVVFIVDMLQVLGFAVKVNAYDDVRIVDASFRSKYFLTTIGGRYQGLQPQACRKPSRDKDPNLSLPTEHQSSDQTSANHSELQDQRCKDDVGGDERMKTDGTSSKCVCETDTSQCMPSVDSHSYRPILPWINGDGATNPVVYKGLVRRVLGIVMQNPAILEDDIVNRMDVLNPQSCRKLLELMILDNHLTVRKMHQLTSNAPPSILTSLIHTSFKKSATVCRQHFFTNPMSTMLL